MWVDQKLIMCLIWRVIDYERWSKTSHVFDMVSYWLRELIENSSCVWYGELLNTRMYRKLVNSYAMLVLQRTTYVAFKNKFLMILIYTTQTALSTPIYSISNVYHPSSLSIMKHTYKSIFQLYPVQHTGCISTTYVPEYDSNY